MNPQPSSCGATARRSAPGSRGSSRKKRGPRKRFERKAPMTLPTLFIPPGAGPCFFMDWTRGPADTWDKTAAWLKGLVAGLPERPKAILTISGHWEEPVFTVGSSPAPPMLFDYYGFPEETYRLTFDAPGSPALAKPSRDLLAASGFPTCEVPPRREGQRC